MLRDAFDKNLPKRKAKDVQVPELGKNSAERKRLLNVLAQRRYRQRRKEHIKRLEEQVAQPVSPASSSILQESELNARCTLPEQKPQQTDPIREHYYGLQFTLGSLLSSAQPTTSLLTELQPLRATSSPDVPPKQLPLPVPWTPEDALIPVQDHSADWTFSPIEPDLSWDPSILLPSIPSTPLSSTGGSMSNNDTTSSNTSPSSTATLSPSFSEPTAMQFDFPDEANLKMLELDLLRAGVTIARRMHIDDLLWQMEAISPYTDPSMLNKTFEHLPMNLWPTKAQQTIQHHPFLDLLPWPTVRNKLLAVFSQPLDVRPPAAASPTAVLDLVYDIEDSAEGVRVWGDDPCSGLNWEVGQKVFERWWWAFDRDIINRSNELRRERGAPSLRGGFVEEIS